MKTNSSKEQIIKDYDKIVKYVIKDMKLGYKFDELFDVGVIGFVRGINAYDENKGFTYITFLYDCIKYEITHYLQYESSKKRKGEIVSLSSLISDDTELQDLIGYETDYSQDSYINEMLMIIKKRSVDFTKKQKIIFNHLYGLNGYQEMTVKEIGEKYGLSRQNINQIKKQIINKLRFVLMKYQNEEGKYSKKHAKKSICFFGDKN